jgi:hypothetical protein
VIETIVLVHLRIRLLESAVADEAIRAGRVMRITDTVERVTGRPPHTFEEWAERHAARFA